MAKLSYFLIFFLSYLLLVPFCVHHEILILSTLSFFIISYQILFSKIRFSINNIFLFGFAYIMFLYPFFYSLGLVNIPTYSKEIFNKSIIISFIALITYSVTYNFFFKAKLVNNISTINQNKLKYLDINKVGFLTSLLIFYFYFTIFGQGVFNKDIILFTGLIFLIYTLPEKYYFLVTIIFLIFMFLILTSSSGRRDIIKLVLIFLFFMQVYYGNFSILSLFIGLCFTIICMGIITALRSYSIWWGYDRNIGLYDIFSDSSYLDKVFTGYGSFLKNSLVLGDFGVAYNNYVFILKNITEIGYLYGQSFIRFFTFFIPRSIWPEKPVDVQILIVNLNTNPHYTSGTSQSTSLIGEVFWNFGFISVIIFFFVTGIIIKKLDNISLSPGPQSFLILMSLTPFFMLMWRGAFSTTFIYALANILILLACLTISKISISKRFFNE